MMGDRKIATCKSDIYKLRGGRKYAYVVNGDNYLIYEADHVGVLSRERFKKVFQTEEQLKKTAREVTLETRNKHLQEEVETLRANNDGLFISFSTLKMSKLLSSI